MHTGEVKLDYLCVEEVTFRGTSQKYRGTVFHRHQFAPCLCYVSSMGVEYVALAALVSISMKVSV